MVDMCQDFYTFLYTDTDNKDIPPLTDEEDELDYLFEMRD